MARPANVAMEQCIHTFIIEQRSHGHEPTIAEIMAACQCAAMTAMKYRRILDGVQPRRYARDAEQRVHAYLQERREAGKEPSVAEIMAACDCSHGTAIKHRKTSKTLLSSSSKPSLKQRSHEDAGTPLRQRIYEYVAPLWQCGYEPTVREIAVACQCSIYSASTYLRTLKNKAEK